MFHSRFLLLIFFFLLLSNFCSAHFLDSKLVGEDLLSLPLVRVQLTYYQQDTRSPQLWKNVFLCGTELEQLEEIYKIQWDFSHLDKELQITLLGKVGKICCQELQPSHMVYLFGSTEPQMFPISPNQTTVIHIPVIIAVKTAVSLPEKVGLNSVQMVEEKIVPMSEYKMSWAPLAVPPLKQHPQAETPERKKQRRVVNPKKNNIWCLSCSQRKARGVLKNLKEERTRAFDYCMPYIFLPHKQEAYTEETCVDIICELPGRKNPLVFDFDWEMDEVEEVVKEKKEEESLKNAVAAAKKKIKDQKEALRSRIEEIPDNVRNALKEIKLYKFYPLNELCQPMKSKYINRYYGQADEVL
ncbi:hypothetical protein GUITHDRAFT_143568 [Guillardia theta CCMP2712]|uniref:Uncharacterized protein n=1 Tax=Guillardia theta (strain CCMP2712) TaxID=905079 RepID=L1ISY9_GUITC|nr:hypothetical protein GUITHDRAFT_143568 [Guillardia theta CCMP2712]EKX39371.1 hypothetical protein GUITHDRAFT_143568 [Guillardia theta CCMP2712]|eukprot:XP_005826351.1 hypothetical protein GUITHDRAFT_143568 [Guillardia theta CCMP2712]